MRSGHTRLLGRALGRQGNNVLLHVEVLLGVRREPDTSLRRVVYAALVQQATRILKLFPRGPQSAPNNAN